jgi:integrase
MLAPCSDTAVLSHYLLELRSDGHTPRTVGEYLATIRHWERTGLTPIEYLAGLNVKTSTRVTRGRILNAYFSWAVRHHLADTNPLNGVRFRMPSPPPVRPFTPGEISALLGNCHRPLEWAVIKVLLDTGLRASELAGVQFEDIDEERGLLVVKKGKGGKVGLLAASEQTLRALMIVAAQRPSYWMIYRLVRDLGKRAGLDDVHPHRFRHTFASNFRASGGDILHLQMLLRHADLGTTRRYILFYEVQEALAAHRRFLAG